MVVPSIQAELLAALDKLNESQQRRVLEYARRIPKTLPVGLSGKRLLEFAGTLSVQEAEEMSRAIDDAFGKVEHDG